MTQINRTLIRYALRGTQNKSFSKKLATTPLPPDTSIEKRSCYIPFAQHLSPLSTGASTYYKMSLLSNTSQLVYALAPSFYEDA